MSALSVEDLWVSYPLLRTRRRAAKSRTALRGISLEVRRGELVGVIGANGAGKTTLLQAAAGVFPPTAGTVRADGRVVSLVELSGGFHRELTGEENVVLSGVLLGLTRHEVRERFDSILDFAGLSRDVLDEATFTYSAGMMVRLAFALVVHAEPDVLLLDEVLAAADDPFKRACFDRLQSFRERGGAVLWASHDLDLVVEHSDRAIELARGEIHATGPAFEVVQAYRFRSPDTRDDLRRDA